MSNTVVFTARVLLALIVVATVYAENTSAPVTATAPFSSQQVALVSSF